MNVTRPYLLFLDDNRKPNQVTWLDLPQGNWVIVRSLLAFQQCISANGLPEFISFDHDLLPEHYQNEHQKATGAHCATWLVDFCKKHGYTSPPYAIHSLNKHAYGRITNIMGYLPQMLDRTSLLINYDPLQKLDKSGQSSITNDPKNKEE